MVFAGICRKDIHLQIDGAAVGAILPPPGDEETCARIAEAFGMSEEALRARGEAFRTEQARAEQKKREKELTPEQLAELKYGTKKLLVALGVIVAAALLAVLFPLLLTLLL